MSQALSGEFVLAAACCQWPPSRQRDDAIRAAAHDKIDWNKLRQIVWRQRVGGLVYDGLNCAGIAAPAAALESFHHQASYIARLNLRYLVETARLQRLFKAASIPTLAVKGVTLAQLAYGNIAVKHSWDIDLVISPDDVAAAFHLLQQQGYHPHPPVDVEKALSSRWLDCKKEHAFFHETSDVYIELHWRLLENPAIAIGPSATPAVQTVTLPSGLRVDTLGDQELFFYLCIHGAWHAWSRLKWLADVAALVSCMTEAELKSRLTLARSLGADRCVAQAVLLCDRVFALPQAKPLAASLRHKRIHRWLETLALWVMTDTSREMYAVPFRRTIISCSHFALGCGWRYLFSEISRRSINPADERRLALPKRLHFLYYVLRVPLWLARQIKWRGNPPAIGMPATPAAKREAMSKHRFEHFPH